MRHFLRFLSTLVAAPDTIKVKSPIFNFARKLQRYHGNSTESRRPLMPTALDFSGKEPSKCTIIGHKGGISMDILSLKNISFKKNLTNISLSTQNISFKNILTNISLNVPQNGFITLSGPSGSGKSTILKICARMLTQSTGELIFEGKMPQKHLWINIECRFRIVFNNRCFLEIQWLITLTSRSRSEKNQ